MKKYSLLLIILIYSANALAQDDYLLKVQEDLKKGNYEQARVTLDNIKGPSSPENLSLLGEVELRLGNLDAAENSLKKALQLLESAPKENQNLYANTLNRLALVFWNKGQDDEARRYMLQAIDVRSKKDDIKNEQLAASFNDLGLITSRSNPEDALSNYMKALHLYEKEFGKMSEKVAQGLINSGIIFRQMESYGNAEANFLEAQQIIQNLYPNVDHPTEAFILTNLGQNYQAQKRLDLALTHFEQALNKYKKIYGPKHPEIANIYNLMGQNQLQQNDYEKALENFQQAFIANSSGFSNEDLSTYPALDDYYQPYTLLNTLLNKSRAYQQIHFNKTLKFKHLKEALNAIDKSDSLIVRLRRSATNENDKLALTELASDIYAEAVNLSYLMGDRAFLKDQYYKKAFYYAEKSKASVLQDAITNSRAKKYANIPEDVLTKERMLLTWIDFLERQIAEKPDKEAEQKLRITLFDVKREHDLLVNMLEKEYPSYYKLKYQSSFPSIEEIQKQISKETAVISYFPAEELNKIFIFLITKNKFKVIQKNIDENYQRYIAGLRNGIYFRDKETYIMSAEFLSDLLLPNIPSYVKTLSVIPAGKLGFVPFETLFHKNLKTEAYEELPYLIKKYSVNYSYSISFLTENKNEVRNKNILLMAPVEFNYNEMRLPTLLGTEQECQQIKQRLAEKNYNVQLLLKGDAQEQVMKKASNGEYGILHLATHGMINEDNPDLSRIYFDPGVEDGRLYTGEIYNLNLNSNLITLSACETGLGKINKGEGILGFTRALLYAGAQNIVVSLWTVNDLSTAELMANFYEKISETTSYSISLQEAKFSMINNSQNAEPYYWAPFILVGE